MKHTTLLLLTTALCLTHAASAQPVSAVGTTTAADGVLGATVPEPGESRAALGLRWGRNPMADFRWLLGLSDRWALDVAVASSGVEQEVRLGLRARLVDDGRRGLSARASVFQAHTLGEVERLVMGAGPGLVVGFAAAGWRFSASSDLAATVLDLRPYGVGSAPLALRTGAAACTDLIGLRLEFEAGAWLVGAPDGLGTLPFASLLVGW